ncbi:hypothetical protein Ahy_A05g022121 [Arachis hypogaea]|uniref:Transposase MuDR plant domain-containing protein n=1 Tax=Arachis hypogaea TaxID=3818 RepID=A0A445CZP7_ARAHY|nr:hypothetical protein Ahy_A05g022121 [Arachis hypogaea]
MIELYVEFKQQSGLDAICEKVNIDNLGDIDWEEDNNDSEEEFEANYEVHDKNDDGDLAGNPTVQNEVQTIVNLEAMHALEFPEYANMGEGNVATEDGEFSVRMEFGSRELVISKIKSYTISRGIDYTIKLVGRSGDTMASTCTMGTISQYHAKLDSNTIADAIRPLVEADPLMKVKSIIAEVQSRFNYTISYRKTWLVKQKYVTKVFGD